MAWNGIQVIKTDSAYSKSAFDLTSPEDWSLTRVRYVNFTTQERAYKLSFFQYVYSFVVYAVDEVVPHYVST